MNDLLIGLTGNVVTPFDPIYNEARQDYNRAVQHFPFIIVYCRNRRDVSNAVIWSRKHCVPIRIRSGGHNYEGYSNGDCVLVIDISGMNHMSLDENRHRLLVEGGVTNGQVYEFTASKGYPFPGGTCPTVGVSGYASGGGWGLSCRNFGLGCDSLEEIELVNYEGSVIRASRTINTDLFWACRGAGGGNFGVIVSMTFRLPPKVNMVTLIEIDYPEVCEREQEEFLSTWQEWLKTADDRITLISRVYNSERDNLAMLVRGIFYGEPEEATEIMADFLAFRGAEYNIEYMTFLEAVTIIGSSYPPYEKFQSASRFAVREFTPIELSELAGLVSERPRGSVFAGLSMYALGGKVAETGIDDTAFFYRKANYIIWLETVWEENRYAEENREWISSQFPYLEGLTTGSYVNFPYGRLPDYLGEYYGDHVSLLEKTKTKYDPLNIFTFPQSIRKSEYDSHEFSNIPKLPADKFREKSGRTYDTNYRGFRYVPKKN